MTSKSDKTNQHFSDRNAAIFEKRIGQLLTLQELAEQLKISVSGLRKILARDCNFPKYKVGHQLRFRWEMVERYFLNGGT
jgi:hypothetical protein